MSKNPVISLKNIFKHYKQSGFIVDVLKNVNLTVKEAEMIAIVGSSGSGKSTLLHIAGLLDSADSGSVDIDGVSQNRMKNMNCYHDIRLQNMGFIYQHHHLLKDFNAQENVAMPLILKNIQKKKAYEEAADILSAIGLKNKLFNMPGELSGGERQRVAIGRALITSPKIILADEPTGNLDPDTAYEIFNLFLERAKKFNTAIIMVSHNTELAWKMDKVYKLTNCGLQQIAGIV